MKSWSVRMFVINLAIIAIGFLWMRFTPADVYERSFIISMLTLGYRMFLAPIISLIGLVVGVVERQQKIESSALGVLGNSVIVLWIFSLHGGLTTLFFLLGR